MPTLQCTMSLPLPATLLASALLWAGAAHAEASQAYESVIRLGEQPPAQSEALWLEGAQAHRPYHRPSTGTVELTPSPTPIPAMQRIEVISESSQ